MLENNFEKNVQTQMGAFKVRPSDEVWIKVEERIRDKKKKRIFFIIFLFSGLALLGYWQRHYFIQENKLAAIPETNAINKTETESSAVKQDKSTVETNNKELPVERSAIHKTQQINTSKETNREIPAIKKAVSNPEKNKKTAVLFISTENKTVPADTKVKAQDIARPQAKTFITEIADVKEKTEKVTDVKTKNEEGKSEEKIIQGKIDNEKIEKQISLPKDNIFSKEEKAVVSEIYKKEQADTATQPETKSDSVAFKKPIVVTSKKWKWGVQFTPGISSLTDNFFSLSMNKSMGYASPQTGSANATPVAGPSASTSGFAFQTGVFAQRKISRRLQLSIGLQYAYYSSHLKVGGNRDSVLNLSNQFSVLRDASTVFSSANTFKNYTNSYHFAELPLSLHIQLNKNIRKPFYFNLGFTAGQMIGSNALVYDTSFGGIYIKTKKPFNKTQLSLSSGLMWTITGKKLQWNIGPFFDMHVNRLLNNSVETDKYLSMFGLKTRIILPAKK